MDGRHEQQLLHRFDDGFRLNDWEFLGGACSIPSIFEHTFGYSKMKLRESKQMGCTDIGTVCLVRLSLYQNIFHYLL